MSGVVSPDWLHPSQLERLAPSVSAAVLLTLAGHPRLAARFRASLPSALRGNGLPEPGSPAERLALEASGRIETAGLMMGAAWHARSIALCIGSDLVSAVDAGIGREARVFGLRCAAHAVAAPETLAAEVLIDRVRADGLRCLVRWRDGLRDVLQVLATMKLPREALPESAPEAADPIIADVLERMADAV